MNSSPSSERNNHIPKVDDTCGLKVGGRIYYASIVHISRKIRVRFNTAVPKIGISSRRYLLIAPEKFQPYQRYGIDWIIGDIK